MSSISRWVLIVAVPVGLAAVLAVSLNRGHHSEPVRHPAPQPVTSVSAPPKADPATMSRPAAAPVRLRIPAIDVATRVVRLGLKPDKTVRVPKNADDAGWFRLGPPPGQLGSAVILGHVDSAQGPAVFYRLKTLHAGDRIHVSLSNDTTAHFEITSITTYANEAFPARQIYNGNPEAPSLNLVTCGGAYDRKSGTYQSNVVAHAEFLRTT